MILGALVDLGLPIEWLRSELGRIPLAGYRIEAKRVHRSGLEATKVDVIVDPERDHRHAHDDDAHDHHHHYHGGDQSHSHGHDHEDPFSDGNGPARSGGHAHSHHHGLDPHRDQPSDASAGGESRSRRHSEDGGHGSSPERSLAHGEGADRHQNGLSSNDGQARDTGATGHHHHHHRSLEDILKLLQQSTLDRDVKERSAALFRRLGEVEAAAHGIPIEEVHFHEVGAVDSIVDTVGGVLGLRWLGVDRFVASPLNVGGGTVKTSHGVLSVPAPATAALVRGVPVYGDGEGELLTPTGALLVTDHAQAWGAMPAMRIERIGCGAGSRERAGRPNVFRIIVGEEVVSASRDSVLVLECEIDDLSPQLLGPIVDGLLAAGALDAYLTPVQMKKGRPGVLVTALVPPAEREAAEAVLFRETTTLGVRWQEWNRTTLGREIVTVETAYGPIRVKLGSRNGAVVNAQPEFDDCQRAAASSGVAVKEAWAAAVAAYRRAGEPRS